MPSDYEVVPVASFHPKLSERDKFYQYINGVDHLRRSDNVSQRSCQDNAELNVDPIVEEDVNEKED